jgi:UDP-N-acetylmuramyl pentapeptide phosphotransferase/UDP-N-acetylglucosamine-1-phosphate transferase
MTHYAPLVALVTTLLALTAILTIGRRAIVHDIPNERSLHDKPVPRVGGIALLTGVLAGWALLSPSWSWWLMSPMLGLFALSLLDDLRGLSARTRLIAHLAAALVALHGAGIAMLWLLPLLLFSAWMTNLYNFMDGSDGLAGGMALFGFGSYGVGAWLSGDEGFALLSLSIAGASLGFLMFNFHPAKVFMGDAGSIPLGFLAALLGIHGWQQELWPLWFPLMVFSPFIVDATLTLFKRLRRGEKLSQAHRSHYYQRLVQMGWGHRNTALAEYALMLLMGVSALSALSLPASGQYAMLLLGAALYAAIAVLIDRRWHRQGTAHA